MQSRTTWGPFSSTSTVRVRSSSRHGGEVVGEPRGLLVACGEDLRQGRRRLVIEARPGEVRRAAVGQRHRIDPSAEDRPREPLVHREHEVPERVDEGPLTVDGHVQVPVGESSCPGDGRRPRLAQRRPPGAHRREVGGAQHGPQGVPAVVLVDVRRHVDPVDHDPVDERVDLDVDEPGVGDRDLREVDVAEPCAAQVGSPEHRATQVTLEPLRHTLLPSSADMMTESVARHVVFHRVGAVPVDRPAGPVAICRADGGSVTIGRPRSRRRARGRRWRIVRCPRSPPACAAGPMTR